MKKISAVIAVILIAMACYFLFQGDRLSNLMSRAGEKEFVKAPVINLHLGKIGVKDTDTDEGR